MQNKSTYASFSLIYLPYLVVLSLGFAFFIYFEHLRHYEVIKSNELLQIDLAGKSLNREFDYLLPDIELLVTDDRVRAYIDHFDSSHRAVLQNKFAQFAHSKQRYQQVRILDINGKERIRVDYRDGKIKICPENELQDKEHRYYFTEGIRRARGEIYISPIDLNIEHGEIEVPHAPMIRFAIPLYDSKNEKKGLMVLNFEAKYLLHFFDRLIAGSYGHLALLNADGYWIRSHKPEREWGFMFDKGLRYADIHPGQWNIIAEKDAGQFNSDDGLFTYKSIYPLARIGKYLHYTENRARETPSFPYTRNYYWKIVSHVPTQVLLNKTYQHLFGVAGLTWLTFAIFGLFVSTYLAKNLRERERLRNQLELHSRIYHNSTDGVIITDADQHILDANQAFLDICGYCMKEIIGNKPYIFCSDRHDGDFYQAMWQNLERHGHWEGEIENRHKDGSLHTEWVRITAMYNDRGDVRNYIALVSDITSRKLIEERLLKHAHHDPLTGAHNRRSFEQRFKDKLLTARRNRGKLALLYFDVDNLKPINDAHGHEAGDMVLLNLAKRLTRSIRETDTLARLGGDEFVVILSEVNSDEDAEKIANTLCSQISEPIPYGDIQLQVSASVGIALYPRDGHDEQQLIQEADHQMYRNKKQSKGDTDNP